MARARGVICWDLVWGVVKLVICRFGLDEVGDEDVAMDGGMGTLFNKV